jgi:chromosome partitioning protein
LKIIAIVNQKGGVGKTTTAANLGAALADRGQQVLLIDLDPQGNLTIANGIQAHELKNTIYEVLKRQAPIGAAVVKVDRPGSQLDLIPAALNLSGAEAELISEAAREYILKEALQGLDREYDFILIDCPPSLGLLTINALAAADGYIIPLAAEFLALFGTNQLLQVVDIVKQRLNANLNLTGVVITQYDNRKLHCQQIAEQIKEFFGEKVFNTIIKTNVSLTEAPSFGQDILTYKKSSQGAADYWALSGEFLEGF